MSQGKQCKNQYSNRKAVGLCDTAILLESLNAK